MKRAILAAALAGMIASASAAQAAIVTLDLDFTATTSGPISSHSGSFSYTYDDVTFAATLNSIDFAIGGTTFTTANTEITREGGAFFLGGTNSGLGILPMTDDFALAFIAPSNAQFFVYGTVSTSEASFFGTATLTPHVAVNPVPEPATWALMILGFASVGAALRRRPRLAS